MISKYATRASVAMLILVAVSHVGARPTAADDAVLPQGFGNVLMFDGLRNPVSVQFAPDGRVFVAEKRGRIVVFDGPTDTTPTTVVDLETNVHNFWDRGMLGFVLDPAFPVRPFGYVLYTYNHRLSDPPEMVPAWPSDPLLTYNDRCPGASNGGPGSVGDGCVVSGRLSRIVLDGATLPTTENVLVEDWCQQFPSHSVGALSFGPEGALYASAGDGASFTGTDYGQLGGTVPDTTSPYTPRNPCGDPPGGIGAMLTPPSAEGGALRSQDIRTRLADDPVGLDGTIIRIDPDTGAAWPSNERAEAGDSDPNARRIIAYGLRNPFRFAHRPGTDDLWIGDVGWSSWEELNEIVDPDAAPRNFGWPCYEGPSPMAAYQIPGLALCASLPAGSVSAPAFAYEHSGAVSPTDGTSCQSGGSSLAGLAFLGDDGGYPTSYDRALFFTDYSRRCIWSMKKGPDGRPDPARVDLFARLPTSGSVYLTTSPVGDLVYIDYDHGEVHSIAYFGAQTPPQASFVASPEAGIAPLAVAFDASTSSDADGDELTYAWDLDGDGQFDDAVGSQAARTYGAVGTVVVGLRVSDGRGGTDVATRSITAGNSAPTVEIVAPIASLAWAAEDRVDFLATAADVQDGSLAPSAFAWELEILHGQCPSDCHAHMIEEYAGIEGGTFDAPGHDYPSSLRLTVTVTDSGGLTATDEQEIQPRTATVAVVSDPAGLPLAVGDTTGTPPAPVIGIVGTSFSVTAPAQAVVGETTYGFSSWSDGGSATHDVTVDADPVVVTARYAFAGSTDAPDTCTAAPLGGVPTDTWTSGRTATTDDYDWYRFRLTSTARMRLVLGDAPAGGRLELYRGCTERLVTSDRPGTTAEEIYRTLGPGSYGIRVVGSGDPSTPPYALRVKKLPASLHLQSYLSRIDGGSLRLVGEVYNNTSLQRGPVVVTARLYDSAGRLLTTRSATVGVSRVRAYSAAGFVISGTLPAGFSTARYSVVGPVSTTNVTGLAVSVASSTADATGRWVVSGSVRNGAAPVRYLRILNTLYDSRARVLDVVPSTLSRTTLAAGATATFKATTATPVPVPNRVDTVSLAFR